MKNFVGSSVGILSIFLIIRYLSLVVLFVSDISEPILFTVFPSYWPSVIGTFLLTLAESIALLLILKTTVTATNRISKGVFLAGLLIFSIVLLFYLIGNLSLLYYSYFKVFPDQSLMALIFSEEESFLYAANPFLFKVIASVIALSVIQSILVTITFFMQRVRSIAQKEFFISGIAIASLCYLALSGFINPFRRSARFPFLHHTFPEYALLADLLSAPEQLVPEKFLDILPVSPQITISSFSKPRPRHVVLVILECVRPDYIPLYNRSRLSTMPMLASDADKWISFEPLYAHGPDSETAIPVLMTSQYRAALRRIPTSGYTETWNSLRKHGVKTSFFSAGSLTWAGLRGRLGITQVDQAVGRGDLTETQKEDPDSAIVELWREFFEENSTKTTFSTLHFVGTHFPYSGDVEAVSKPPVHIEELKQAYAGALVKVDRHIHALIQYLQKKSVLEDAVIMVTSDHGEGLGEHGTLFHGSSVFEEIVRVPLLIRVGSALSPLREALINQASQVRGHIDVVPTIFDLFSLDVPSAVQGDSLLTAKRRSFEVISGAKFFGLSNGRVKLVADLRHGILTQYDLQKDPKELIPVQSQNITSVCSFVAEAARLGWKLNACPSKGATR
jgi:glucan phosphoethanolaminetransferase (alkaline phosphatase superfamily)